MTQKTVLILSGFAEGPKIERPLVSALSKAGFAVTNQCENAHIILAHSGGCFFLPKTTKEQAVLLINPPYWEKKSIMLRFMQKVSRDFKVHAQEKNLHLWIKKSIWSVLYIFLHLRKSIKTVYQAKNYNTKKLPNNKSVTILHNQNDAWCSPDIAQDATEKGWDYVEMDGEHDDCWTHPEKYVRYLVKHYS